MVGRKSHLIIFMIIILILYNNLIPFLALPIISSANASILIEENDNPRGIFSFTSSSFTAEEGTTDSITVTRTAGTYGEVS